LKEEYDSVWHIEFLEGGGVTTWIEDDDHSAKECMVSYYFFSCIAGKNNMMFKV